MEKRSENIAKCVTFRGFSGRKRGLLRVACVSRGGLWLAMERALGAGGLGPSPLSFPPGPATPVASPVETPLASA